MQGTAWPTFDYYAYQRSRVRAESLSKSGCGDALIEGRIQGRGATGLHRVGVLGAEICRFP
jgi:hypothetical protein